jgi:hypothetical protein
MKAQQIAPKNGRPYNQLAILALYTVSSLYSVDIIIRDAVITALSRINHINLLQP